MGTLLPARRPKGQAEALRRIGQHIGIGIERDGSLICRQLNGLNVPEAGTEPQPLTRREGIGLPHGVASRVHRHLALRPLKQKQNSVHLTDALAGLERQEFPRESMQLRS